MDVLEYKMTRPGGYAKPNIRTTVNITPEFYKLCKEHRIMITEALRVGISIMLAEKDIMPYDNRLNIMRKMQVLRKTLEETSEELLKLKEKLKKKGKNGK